MSAKGSCLFAKPTRKTHKYTYIMEMFIMSDLCFDAEMNRRVDDVFSYPTRCLVINSSFFKQTTHPILYYRPLSKWLPAANVGIAHTTPGKGNGDFLLHVLWPEVSCAQNRRGWSGWIYAHCQRLSSGLHIDLLISNLVTAASFWVTYYL